jgi:galactitol-specific phosphotransferase system IIB component
MIIQPTLPADCCLHPEQDVISGQVAQSIETDTQQLATALHFVNLFDTISSASFLEDCQIIKPVTTIVNEFNPFELKARPERFIPILEARGGTDKDEFGHRRDSIPIANALAKAGSHSAIFQFLEENDGTDIDAVKSNDALYRFLQQVANGVVVRVNPGTLSAQTQMKIDQILRDLSCNENFVVMSHPDVVTSLGAKDALVRIRHLKSGLEDTEVYYEPESFKMGFRKSIAFQPRVIKQNRGSQGEGIWICKLKDESAYCSFYGESIVDLDTELVLMEANDNHVEHHTVEEFLEWCINGRSESAGEWQSTGKGKYFDGGMEANAMLVDQRFLPRIVEGEVRCLMVGSELIELVHKKPAENGLSATLQSGAVYTTYSPDDPKFSALVSNFKEDIPILMDAFGFSNQPLPLIWTADYIMGETDNDFHVGEFNCSCVGLTQQLEKCDVVAKTAMDAVFSNK